MATSLTRPAGGRSDDVRAMRFRLRDVAFTGSYQDDQSTSTVTADQVGLNRIVAAIPAGVAAASDLATANPVAVDVASDGQSVAFALYENGASGAALAEKTDNEAFPTGATVPVLFIGF